MGMSEDQVPLLANNEDTPRPESANIHETIPVPGGEEPPPAFTPYEAEHFEIGDGNIVSHDPHLNSDGEALYRFLLSQAQNPPSYILHCKGTHTENRLRWVTYEHGEGDCKTTESRCEHYSETVTDFDFRIDIGQHIVPAPVEFWSVADSEPAYRGAMVREVEDLVRGKHAATSAESKAHEKWAKVRTGRGLPPWASASDGQPEAGDEARTNVLRSSKTLRQWADEYCSSPKLLKEFVYEKVLYGWNIQEMEKAVRGAISTSPYSGKIQVSFKTYGSKVYVRPDNTLSRILSRWWVKALMWASLVYPFVWLFKRFHSLGGGRWQVCGGAYALKRWMLVDPGNDESCHTTTGSDEKVNQESDRIVRTPSGAHRLVGVREGEWFRVWQGTIIRAVVNGYQSSTPLYAPDPSAAGYSLDGY